MEKTGWKKIRLGIGIAGLVLMPAVSYVLFEWVTGNLQTIYPLCAAVNILLMGSLYLAVFALTGRSRIAVPAASFLLFGLSVGETFVMEFRGRPIMPADFMAFQTALTVAGNYAYTVTREMVLSGLCLLSLNVGLFFCPVRLPWWKVHLGFAAGSAAVICGGFTWLIQGPVASGRFGINMWDLNSSYETEGYILSTVMAGTYLVKDRPAAYSDQRLEAIYEQWNGGEDSAVRLASVTSQAGTDETVTPVNIICIMNESFSDLRVAGKFETNEEFMPYFDSLRETAITGNLYMPVFGAGTSNSEFEFLSGDAMAMMAPGTTAYQFNVTEGEGTLVSTLKEQGYETIALHPYPGENWNRDTCYRNMGFDQFLEWEYFQDCPLTRCYVGDLENYRKMVQVLEDKDDPSEKVFLFNVTMQNHGGFDKSYSNFTNDVQITDNHKNEQAEQYLSLIKKTDEAFEYLVDYFSGVDEPTIIVMFGDHQPAVTSRFYDSILGKSSDELTSEELMKKYQTPFIIWANYDIEETTIEKMSANYLSAYVLQEAGLKMTPYQKFLMKLYKKLPVISAMGAYDADGYYYESVKETPYEDMVQEYQILQYNNLIDTDHTVNSFFYLKE